jgi:hypothetical protein
MANVAPAAQGVVVIDRNADLAAYDALPKRWRELVDSLPIPQECSRVAEYLTQLGDARGYEAAAIAFETGFPGWKRP